MAEGAGEVPYTVTFAPAVTTSTKPPDPPRKDHTISWIAIGVGGTLVLTGGVLLIAREGAISEIESACPNNVCPAARRDDVERATIRVHDTCTVK